MNNKKNKNINISKILAFCFIFIFLLFPIKFSFAFSLPSREANSIFIKLQEEIADIHLKIIDKSTTSSYSPEEEAVIVVTKNVINQKLVNLNFKQLPKEFLIKILTEGGKKAFSVATNDSFDLITSEIIGRAVDEIIDILEDEEVYINSGEVEIGYRDINQEKRKEVLYYSIIMDKKTGETSVSFYSEKEFFAPESKLRHVTSYLSPAKNTNTQWSIDKFKGEKLRPFIVTFSGTIVEGSTGALKFVGDVGFDIDFMSWEEIEELRNVVIIQAPSVWEEAMETAINVGGFFVEKTGEAADLVGDGWKKTKDFIGGAFGGFSGVNSYGEGSGVVIDLNDINRNYSSDFTQPEEKVDDKVDDGREESVEGETTETEKETEVEKEEQQQYQEESIVSVELNSAIGEDLELLSGIGPVYAERIIGNRPFCSLDDLTKVPGIGEATLRNIKEQGLVYVSPVEICFQEEEIEEEDEEEEVDEDVLEKFEEIKRRIERLREKVDEKTGSEEKQEEEIEEEEEKDEEEQEENEKQFSGCKDGQINLNYADKEILQEIVGIGSGYAQQIIELREEEPFWTLECLDRVNGIALGGSRLNKIIEEDLACAADKNDDSFDHFEKEKKSSSGGGGGGGSSPPPDDSDDEDEDGGENDEDEDEEEEEEEDEKEIILTHLSEIKHGDEEGIEVKIEILNFENTLYDVKVAIEADGDLYFSEIYNNEEGWKSAFNYLKTMQGPSEEKTFRLRIKDGKDYEGTGKIVAKIRKDGSIVKEEESAIEILKKEESGNDENDDEGSNDEEGGGDDNEGDEEEKDPIEFEIVITGAETIWNAGLFSEDIDASDANIGKYTEAIVSKAEYVVQNEMKSGNIDASDAEAGDYTEAIVSRAGYLWQNLLIKEEFCYDQ